MVDQRKPQDVPGLLPVRSDWLSRVAEDVIDPALPIVDAHHHLWDPSGARYLLDEFLDDLQSGHRIDTTVFVECHGMYRARGPEAFRTVGETEFAAGIAAQSDSGRYGETRVCAAIVAAVDYSLGDAFEPVLEAHRAASGGRLRGFRGRVSSHPDPTINRWGTPPGILVSDAATRAIGIIARQGCTLDIWAYQTQIDDILQVCRRFPDLPVIVDHVGGFIGCEPFSSQKAEHFAAWARGIDALASYPNTYVKISGMASRFMGFAFHLADLPPTSAELAEAWRPFFDHSLNAFGPARSMFASNFPVDKGMCGYRVLWNAFKRLSESCSPAEKQLLFSGTANRVYRLNES